MFQEEQLDNLRECMALNSASTSSDSDSEVSEVIHKKTWLFNDYCLPTNWEKDSPYNLFFCEQRFFYLSGKAGTQTRPEAIRSQGSIFLINIFKYQE